VEQGNKCVSSELFVAIAKAFTINNSLEHFHWTDWDGYMLKEEQKQIVDYVLKNHTLRTFVLCPNTKLQKQLNKITVANRKRISTSKRFGKTKSAAKRKHIEHEEELPSKQAKI